MPVTVVVGGQFGSEGKGKVAHFLAKDMGAKIAVRVGGSNSGHTVITPDGNAWIFRHLPTAAILPDVKCILPAGSYIDPHVLGHEISKVGITEHRLIIDPNAVIISTLEREEERSGSLRDSIGSTVSGTGAAVANRIKRDSAVRLAKDESSLQKFIKATNPLLRQFLECGQRIIIEGTQGFGLSLLHSPHYPFVTSRDTTAAGFLSETGLSPLDVDDIVLVLRAFPIRVAGHSGPLCQEISWETVTSESGSQQALRELTSVTKSLRRVARFDPDVVNKAIAVNRPTRIVMNHLDYLDVRCKNKEILSPKVREFVLSVESLIGMHIDFLGCGPDHLERSEGNMKTVWAAV